MSTQITLNQLADSINKAIADKVKEAVEEAAEEAADKARRTVLEQADRLALHVLGFYELETMTDRIVITVKKDRA